jgi:hypothetical protein
MDEEKKLTAFEEALRKGMGSFGGKSQALRSAEKEIERLRGICRAHGIPFAQTVAARVAGRHLPPENKG